MCFIHSYNLYFVIYYFVIVIRPVVSDIIMLIEPYDPPLYLMFYSVSLLLLMWIVQLNTNKANHYTHTVCHRLRNDL